MLQSLGSNGILVNELANFASMEVALRKFSLAGNVFAWKFYCPKVIFIVSLVQNFGQLISKLSQLKPEGTWIHSFIQLIIQQFFAEF